MGRTSGKKRHCTKERLLNSEDVCGLQECIWLLMGKWDFVKLQGHAIELRGRTGFKAGTWEVIGLEMWVEAKDVWGVWRRKLRRKLMFEKYPKWVQEKLSIDFDCLYGIPTSCQTRSMVEWRHWCGTFTRQMTKWHSECKASEMVSCTQS